MVLRCIRLISLINVVGYTIWVKCQIKGGRKTGAVQTIFRLRLQAPDNTESSTTL